MYENLWMRNLGCVIRCSAAPLRAGLELETHPHVKSLMLMLFLFSEGRAVRAAYPDPARPAHTVCQQHPGGPARSTSSHGISFEGE